MAVGMAGGCLFVADSPSVRCGRRVQVEFGARMVQIDNRQIKLQIWDTVRSLSTRYIGA